MRVLGLFWLWKLGGFCGIPLLRVKISRSLAVLLSSARCAQLSRVGSVPADEVRGLGLGEGISCFPDVGADAAQHPPLHPPAPPRDLLSRQRGEVAAAHASCSAPLAAPAPAFCCPPLPPSQL